MGDVPKKIPFRETVVVGPFKPKFSDLQLNKIIEGRQQHRLISKSFLWCDWINGVGFLKIQTEYNYCDKCHMVLWSIYDKTPPAVRIKWIRPGNRA